MEKDHHHGDLVEGISKQLDRIISNSEQGIYIYLDDKHKMCNSRFSSLLGYRSPDEWAKVEKSFPEAFVHYDSQKTLILAYQDAMEKMKASAISVTWNKRTGGTVDTSVLLVPMVYQNHMFAIHFVSNKIVKNDLNVDKECAASMLSGD